MSIYRIGPNDKRRSEIDRILDCAREAARVAASVDIGACDVLLLRTYFSEFCCEFAERVAERLTVAASV